MTSSPNLQLQVNHTVLAAAAHRKWQLQSPAARAQVLRHLAATLDSRREDILATCAQETALTIDELAPEFARMTATFRLFAAAITEGTWHVPIIDTRVPEDLEAKSRAAARLIGPNHDIRRTMIVRGSGSVVAVFGASNFPLAYGVCGGDTASALAAGCRVVVKEHPAHPRTGRMIHEVASRALADAGFAGLLGYVENLDPADTRAAKALIAHPLVCAVGFTGSTRGGLAIEELCRARDVPIPAFCEMGSCNPVLVRAGLKGKQLESMVDQLAASVVARVGQQCTKPGLVCTVDVPTALRVYDLFAQRFEDIAARRMLSPGVATQFYARLDATIESGEIARHTRLPSKRERAASEAAPVVMLAKARADARHIAEEVFGPAIVVAPLPAGQRHHPALAGALFERTADLAFDAAPLATGLGRLAINGVTTGVRVAHATVHGGPFPATNAPETTAVGPMAIARWCRPVCYQSVPDTMLPEALQNANPLRWMRLVNGKYTRSPIK
jgi:NADP-dependent aldehyde dehydrogenase